MVKIIIIIGIVMLIILLNGCKIEEPVMYINIVWVHNTTTDEYVPIQISSTFCGVTQTDYIIYEMKTELVSKLWNDGDGFNPYK